MTGLELDAKRCAAEINVKQFVKNYELVKGCVPRDCRMMAVLKGNAYGHGAPVLAKALEKYTGDWIAVASIGEAVRLRDAGIGKDILILGFTAPEDAAVLAEYDITQAVISYEYAVALSEQAVKDGVTVRCHLAVDTGMSRIGLLAYGGSLDKSYEEARKIYGMKGLMTGGIFTHFSSAYGNTEEDREYTVLQYNRFYGFCEKLKASGIDVGIRHCNNSPSVINYPEFALDMCRAGTVLFGFMDKSEMKRPVDLHTVMKFKTVVGLVKEIEAGTAVSYNRTYIAPERRKLAVLSVGWYDGYPRLLGNKGIVLIRGKRYPIVGKVCMDLCMADITGNDDIKSGDEAVLLGRQGDDEIVVSELCKPLGIGPGSIGGGISERVPRIYVEED